MAEVQLRVFDPVDRQFVKTPIATDAYVAISHVWGSNDVTASLNGVCIKVSSCAKAEALEKLMSRSSVPCWLDLVSVNQTSWEQLSDSHVPPTLASLGRDTFSDISFSAVSQVQGMSEIYNNALMTFALLSETDFALLEDTLETLVFLIEHFREIKRLNQTHEYDRFLKQKGFENDEIEMMLIERFQTALSKWQTNAQYMSRVWTYQELTVSNDITYVSHDGSRSVSASELILLLFQLRYDQQRNSYFNPAILGHALHVASALFVRAFLPSRVGLAVVEILRANAETAVIEDKNGVISDLLTAVSYQQLTHTFKLDFYIDILLKNRGMENGWTFNSSAVSLFIDYASEINNLEKNLNLDQEAIDIPRRAVKSWSRVTLSEVLAAMVQCQRKCYFKRDYINVLASLYAPEHITDSDDDLDAKFMAFHTYLIERGLFTLRHTENLCKFCSSKAPSWSSLLTCPNVNTSHLYGDMIMRRSEHFGFLLEAPKLSAPNGVVAILVDNMHLCYSDISVVLDIPDTASKFDVKRQVLLSLARMYSPMILTRLLVNSSFVAYACPPTGLEAVFDKDFCTLHQCYLAHLCQVGGVKLNEVHDMPAWINAIQGYYVLRSRHLEKLSSDLIDRWFMYMADSLYFSGNNNGPVTIRIIKPVGAEDTEGILVLEPHTKDQTTQAKPLTLAKWKDGSYCILRPAEISDNWTLVLNLHWSACWMMDPENIVLGDDAIVV
ncbi:hypothetical protein HDU83_006472 [Entophlyctis luteolus]|nr:hypothetical protein HDU83_006472 [Entophlyctis luteolus]